MLSAVVPRVVAGVLGFAIALGAALAQSAVSDQVVTGASLPSDAPPTPISTPISTATATLTMDQYLDRLMIAESGGRLTARASRSTALGPYQFIERTFFEVARRNFPSETSQLSLAQLLSRRTDPVFARRVAEAYTRESAAHLATRDVAPTWQHLRLSFLLGPSGAVRVVKAPLDQPLTYLLAPAALHANPFLSVMRARDLLARAARDIAMAPGGPEGLGSTNRASGGVAAPCRLALPSCRRWLALHQGGARRSHRPVVASPAGWTRNPSP